MWVSDGVWIGSLSDADWDAGGRWLIGDRHTDGYPGKTDKLLYKSWVAHTDRYRGERYPWKNRETEGHWEFVQVFGGRLELVIKREGTTDRFPLEYPDSVEVPPDILRKWRLPDECTVAYGTTVCRKLQAYPTPAGAGEGYELHSWNDHQLGRLRDPLNLATWGFQFVEVFAGKIVCTVEQPPRQQRYTLGQRAHIFVRRVERRSWEIAAAPALGITLYFLAGPCLRSFRHDCQVNATPNRNTTVFDQLYDPAPPKFGRPAPPFWAAGNNGMATPYPTAQHHLVRLVRQRQRACE